MKPWAVYNTGMRGLWTCFLIGIAACVFSSTASAEEEGDELTIYGTDRSQIEASDLTDTRGTAPTARIDTVQLQDGLATGESLMERKESRVEKPKLDGADREKPDLTPDVSFQVDWKLMLLIGLLESSGKK